MNTVDVAIVGAGPIGIELAVALKRRGISYVHLEAGQVGATMYWWPPGTRWFSSNDRISIAGVPLQTVDQSKATREEYLRYLRSVVVQFGLEVRTYERVVGIERATERRSDEATKGAFVVRASSARGEGRYEARRVVLATGGTAWPRKLGVEGEDLPHVSHFMEDPHKYFQKRVLVVGGKNSAVEAAMRIYNVGAQVAISYRRQALDAQSIKYWLYPEIKSLINAGKMPAYFGTVVRRIRPGEVVLGSCDGKEMTVEADFVLLQVGYVADMSLCRMAAVELVGESEIPRYDEQTMETNVTGVYVAGTAVGGTQAKYQVFLENCHIHVDRIVAAIMGEAPPPPPVLPGMQES